MSRIFKELTGLNRATPAQSSLAGDGSARGIASWRRFGDRLARFMAPPRGRLIKFAILPFLIGSLAWGGMALMTSPPDRSPFSLDRRDPPSPASPNPPVNLSMTAPPPATVQPTGHPRGGAFPQEMSLDAREPSPEAGPSLSLSTALGRRIGDSILDGAEMPMAYSDVQTATSSTFAPPSAELSALTSPSRAPRDARRTEPEPQSGFPVELRTPQAHSLRLAPPLPNETGLLATGPNPASGIPPELEEPPETAYQTRRIGFEEPGTEIPERAISLPEAQYSRDAEPNPTPVSLPNTDPSVIPPLLFTPSRPPPEGMPVLATGRFLVLIGTFTTPRFLDQARKTLLEHGFPVRLKQEWRHGGLLSHIQVGPFSSREDAIQVVRLIRSRTNLPAEDLQTRELVEQ